MSSLFGISDGLENQISISGMRFRSCSWPGARPCLLTCCVPAIVSGLGSLRYDAERAVEAGDDAQSPEEPLPEQLDRLATPGAAKRKLDVDGDGADGAEEEMPQTFERRRKKNKPVGPGAGSGGSLASSQEQQPSEKENAKDTSNVDTQATAATSSTSASRMMTDADFGPSIVGKGLYVYWPGQYSDWFAATVTRFDQRRKKMAVRYKADGYKDTIDLRKMKYLVGKGWIKVCEPGGSGNGRGGTEMAEAGAELPGVKLVENSGAAKPKAGCSKCRYRGCTACRGFKLEKKKPQQGGGQIASGNRQALKEPVAFNQNAAKPQSNGKALDEIDGMAELEGGHTTLRPMQKSDLGPSLKGKELSVFWTMQFNRWFSATVESFNRHTKKAKLCYDEDNFREWVSLSKIKSLIEKDRVRIVVGNGDHFGKDIDDDDGVIEECAKEDGANQDLAAQRSCQANDVSELDLSEDKGLQSLAKEDFVPRLQGRTLSVFWGRPFYAWYRATVQRFDEKAKKAFLYYAADNHNETMDFKRFATLVSKDRIKLVAAEEPLAQDGDASSTREVVRLMTKSDLGRGLKGKDVVVFWTEERYKGWYEATVRGFNQDEGLVKLWYRKDKARETVDPTLMYIPEGRIGFIEERQGDHQLVRGELDVRLLDIKGRVTKPRDNSAAKEAGRGTSTVRDHPGAPLHDEDSKDREEELSEEPSEEEPSPSPSPSQEDVSIGLAAEGQATAPAHADPAFEFGYDGGDDDHGAGPAAAGNEDPATAEDPMGHFIADSYNASPNPSPVQPAPPALRQAIRPSSAEPLHQAENPRSPPRPPRLPEAQATELGPGTQVIPEQEVSASQPSVDWWENDSAAQIFRWLSTSMAHPLSKQANLAKLRPSLQTAVDFILDNVRDTIERSFNNSILVVGAPGSGKTRAVSRVVRQVQDEWNAPNPPTSAAAPSSTHAPGARVGIVRLSGVEFSDERAAFREIARQLCESLDLEYVKSASLGDNIDFLLQILKALAQAGKAAVFVLEEFDLFAHSQKQTFLYCLLDSLQKSQAKAVVIGTTCRHDCLDLLEKRVKSRFSHRSVTLTPPTTLEDGDVHGSGAKSILTDILTLPDGSVAGAESYNDQVRRAMEDRDVLEGLSRVIQFSNTLHTLSRIARKALGAWYTGQAAVDNAADEPLPFAPRHIAQAIGEVLSTTHAGFESIIAKLCPLDLAVLAAAHKAKSGRNDGLLNFEMVHHEFKTFITSSNLHVDNYSRAAASKSFERLVDCGILRHPRSKGGSLSRRDRHYAPVLVQVTRTELQQGLQKHFNASRQLIDWALRGEIHTTALNELA